MTALDHMLRAVKNRLASSGASTHEIHTVLTDNGVQFVQHDKRAESGFVGHIFGAVCTENGIEHRTTEPYHP